MIHTVSSIRTHRTCERLYKHKYIDLVRPAQTAKELAIGTEVGRCLDVVWGGLVPEVKGDDAFFSDDAGRIELARVKAMVAAYSKRWTTEQSDWDLVAVEHEFKVQFGGYWIAGKIDKLIRRRADGQLYIVEHKTTSSEIETVGDDYWQRVALDTQTSVYEEAVLKDFGERPGTLYDVIKKPLGEPKLKEAIRRRKDETDEQLEARKEAVRENLDEFETRLLETMLAEPDEYLVRRIIHRTREQQAGLIAEAVESMTRIEAARSYPRNDTACTVRGKACPYLGVCTGTDSLDSARFVRLERPHQELSQSVVSGVQTGPTRAKEIEHGSSAASGPSVECPV